MDSNQLHNMVMYIDKLNRNFDNIIKEQEESSKPKKFDLWLKGHEFILSE